MEKKFFRNIVRNLKSFGASNTSERGTIVRMQIWQYLLAGTFCIKILLFCCAIILSSFCAPESKIVRGVPERGLVVRSPLHEILDQVQRAVECMVTNAPSIPSTNKKLGATVLYESIDLKHIKEIIVETRSRLNTTASQRITVLGQTGAGKSTTLNMILYSTMQSEEDYYNTFRVARRTLKKRTTQSQAFYLRKFFCDSDSLETV